MMLILSVLSGGVGGCIHDQWACFVFVFVRMLNSVPIMYFTEVRKRRSRVESHSTTKHSTRAVHGTHSRITRPK